MKMDLMKQRSGFLQSKDMSEKLGAELNRLIKNDKKKIKIYNLIYP
jgi:hypothetical protein